MKRIHLIVDEQNDVYGVVMDIGMAKHIHAQKRRKNDSRASSNVSPILKRMDAESSHIKAKIGPQDIA